MNLIELKENQNLPDNTKLSNIYFQFRTLLSELEKKELPENILETINRDIEEINSEPLTDKELRKLIKQKQIKIIKLVEKELKIVPKNHYRNLWVVLGMTAFGLPIGVAFGLIIDNIGLLAVGLPIGMFIGAMVGSEMDKKAIKEERQLDIEIKH